MGKKAADQSAIAWEQVEKVAQKKNVWSLICNHCGHTFTGGVSRVVSHLLGLGNGIKACSSCPEDVQLSLSTAKAGKDAAANAKRKRAEEVQEIRQRKEDKVGCC